MIQIRLEIFSATDFTNLHELLKNSVKICVNPWQRNTFARCPLEKSGQSSIPFYSGYLLLDDYNREVKNSMNPKTRNCESAEINKQKPLVSTL